MTKLATPDLIRTAPELPDSPPRTPSAAELQALVKERLQPYKYPRWVEFVDELPKTASGKVQRFVLRQ